MWINRYGYLSDAKIAALAAHRRERAARVCEDARA